MKISTSSDNARFTGHKDQRGFTLVELMVALVIGLIILLGVAKIFSANRLTYSVLEATGRLQENGQYAMSFISQQLRQTGYYPNPADYGDGSKLDYENKAFGALLPLTGSEGGGANDSLTLAYYTTTTDCVGGAPAGGIADPLMQSTTVASATGPGVPTAIAINTITIANGASGQPAIFCNGVEVAEGIENLQVRYGEDTTDNGAADSFVDFDNITVLGNVITVQVAILVASAREVNQERDTNTYNLLGTTITPPSDGRIRRVYNTSIKLRNRCALIAVISGKPPCA